MKAAILAKGVGISIVSNGDMNDYMLLTDLARYKSEDPAAIIQNWMRACDVIEFSGIA